MVRELHPETDEDILYHRRYGIALLHCPDGFLPCATCVRSSTSDPFYHRRNEMDEHNDSHHGKATICCTVRATTVRPDLRRPGTPVSTTTTPIAYQVGGGIFVPDRV